MEPKFTHLHVHTEYSLLDGLCALDRGKKHASPLMERVQEVGQTALAITDHGNLYGAVHFYKAAKKHGIKPLMGCEVYITPGNHLEKALVNGRQANHLVLLAETNQGFENLMRLVSLAHLEGMYYKPRIDRALLAQHHEGLIALSACLKGEVAEAISDGLDDKAFKLAGEYAEIMGKGNFFLEVQEHGLSEQAPVNRRLVDFSKRLNLPLVATNDVHYLAPEHVESHEMLLCLQTQDKWSNPERMKYGSNQFYLKSEDEMRRLFGELPEAIENTWRIAERCNVELALGGQKNPHFPNYKCPGGLTHKQYLTHLAAEGLRRLYGVEDIDHPKDECETLIVSRFRHELGVIEKTGFLNYFLVVWDFIHAAKEMGIPVGPGRGSGAGSLVAYAIGITGIDPLRYGLIFERFLNPERVSPPDFDIDFCQTRRGEVIDYVKRKYGADSVAQIVTYGTLGAKTVVRDLGRALEFPLPECDKLAKLIPDSPGTTLASAKRDSADFARACATEEVARRIMHYAPDLEDMPRQTGIHAAGVVIGEKPLIEFIPLTRDKEGNVVAQWEAGPLEDSGLLKMDFLGLKTLTVVREACDNVKRTRGIDIDPDALPLDDPKTYELLARGDTVGVFQVESEGMRDLLRELQINKIEELIAMIALYRPGPMGMIPQFIARKHGREPIRYPHPLLEPVLKETYGIMVYQEQVQQAAGVLAGFSMGQGDVLRRAMGKKKPEEMARQREAFMQGCVKRKTCDARVAGSIFDSIAEFASYGFNKSHSAAYGIVTFQTAYLKANYPVEFMAAMLSSEMGNTDKLPVLVAETQKMGIRVLPPDVNESGLRFTPVKENIRYGLAGVKGVGAAAVEAMIRERETNGAFNGFVDFCERMGNGEVNKKAIEALIKCGAFDFTGLSRGRLAAGIEPATAYAASVRKDRAAGQFSLFDSLDGADATGLTMTDRDLPESEAWPQKQMLAFEKELIGFYISGHPLLASAWTLEKFNQTTPEDLQQMADHTRTRIGGLVGTSRKVFTRPQKEGEAPKPMLFFQLETLSGNVPVAAYTQAYAQYGVYLQPDAAVMICGSIRQDRNGSGNVLSVEEVYPIEEVPARFTRALSFHIHVGAWNEEKMRALKDVLRRHPGEIPVNLCLLYPDNSKVYMRVSDHFKIRVSEALVKECEKMVDSVYVATHKQACLRAPEAKWKRNGNGSGA
ncbi:MAG: DNA polymerase III subunit alpha [Verrucomicrobiota bacterium]|jgi:DNA polymerase-3 subunit alpha|nr:DNA polymerase III subunit alpha [Verrucomicrobiota bacterium]